MKKIMLMIGLILGLGSCAHIVSRVACRNICKNKDSSVQSFKRMYGGGYVCTCEDGYKSTFQDHM